MESNYSVKQAAGTSAFLLAGLFIGCYLAGVQSVFLLFAGVWTVIILAVLVKPHISFKQLSVISMYVLVATTFLNQSVLSIEFGFFTLFLYRLALIGAAFIFLVHVAKDRELPDYWNEVQVKGVMLFLLFWLAYGGVSLLWASSIVDGIKYLFLLGIGILFVFLAVFTFTSINRLLLVYGIWMLMTVFLMIIGILNHVAHFQLPTSTLYGGPEYKLSYPTSVFHNQNDFATFLTISFFFYITAAKNSQNAIVKTVTILLAFMAVYLIYLTESRASMLGIIVGLGMYFFILLPKWLKKIAVLSGIAIGLIGAIVFFGKFVNLFSKLFIASGSQPNYEVLSSNVARFNLLKNTMHYVVDTYGFGVGAGNIPFYLKNKPIFNTNYVVEVHNWLAEIIGNFGIIVFLGYALMYFYLLYRLYKAYGTRERKDRMLLEACMLALVGFLISSISPSTMINLYFHWVFIGFVIAVVSVFKAKSMNSILAKE